MKTINRPRRRQPVQVAFASIKQGKECIIDGMKVVKVRDKTVMTADGAVVHVPNNSLVIPRK